MNKIQVLVFFAIVCVLVQNTSGETEELKRAAFDALLGPGETTITPEQFKKFDGRIYFGPTENGRINYQNFCESVWPEPPEDTVDEAVVEDEEDNAEDEEDEDEEDEDEEDNAEDEEDEAGSGCVEDATDFAEAGPGTDDYRQDTDDDK
ncbi:probable DNA-directed RNA polymerase subunit delta [Adelges cooleyi]|uniref:probable DNA-directed RNA polymerase subunit delta n=1 Tax=Adelges cooleyi TaxID=133065 RepID=UPI00217F79DF|nr:probable DNA-directed RNA polymerase subunit delta [Adelges cooleyi]